jgi:hypothetical protein
LIGSLAARDLPYVSALFALASVIIFVGALGRLPRSPSETELIDGEFPPDSKHILPLPLLLPIGLIGLGLVVAGAVMAFAGVVNWNTNRAEGIAFVITGFLLTLLGIWFELGTFVGVMESLGRDGPWTARAKRFAAGMLKAVVPWKRFE